ncbi:MAG: NADH-quinone oxidoreductase subunit N [Nitrospirae bacterium]|nr:MAG: NADH-quinone oxidoreductase subunit N [Nitrospirota bacterium]
MIPDISYTAILPELCLTVIALAHLLFTFTVKGEDKGSLAALAIAALVVAGGAMVPLWGHPQVTFAGTYVVDDFALFFKWVCLLAAALAILHSGSYLRQEGMEHGEYYTLILFAVLGMMVLASARDLTVLYVGLELMSITFYCLVGYLRGRIGANEASLKYFILGAFASGFLLYGFSLLYGITGTTSIPGIHAYLGAHPELVGAPLALAIVLCIVGLGFKVSMVPFHFWSPDVYTGAPTPVTAFLSVGSEAAAFAAILRLFVSGLGGQSELWTGLVTALAVITMTVGNLMAIQQRDVKRMLAYSSVTHAGYILVGVVVGGAAGSATVMFYMLSYAFMNVGAFGVVAALNRTDAEGSSLDHYRGLAKAHPALAATMFVLMLSLAGIPPTAGFFGKFYIFMGAVKANLVWLAVVGMLNSAVSAYYYLRVAVYMYMREPEGEPQVLLSTPMRWSLAASLAGIFALGLFPDAVLALARASAAAF